MFSVYPATDTQTHPHTNAPGFGAALAPIDPFGTSISTPSARLSYPAPTKRFARVILRLNPAQFNPNPSFVTRLRLDSTYHHGIGPYFGFYPQHNTAEVYPVTGSPGDLTNVKGFQQATRYLIQQGYQPGTTLLAYPLSHKLASDELEDAFVIAQDARGRGHMDTANHTLHIPPQMHDIPNLSRFL